MHLSYKPGGMLPGGYPYTDPRTGRKFDGFDAGGAGDQIMRIAKYRMANPRIFPEPEWADQHFIAKQLLEYQFQRLGNNMKYFVATDGTQSNPIVYAPKTPAANVTPPNRCECGANMAPVYCKTCSAQRLTGWKCPTCGRQRGR